MQAHSLLMFAALAGLAGCSFVPGGAPTAYEIEHSKQQGDNSGFLIHPLDPVALEVLKKVPTESLQATFSDTRPSAPLRVGPGDTLQISIWEAGGAGLFGQEATGAGAHNATFQPVTVSQDGFISVPFAGHIKAAGKTPEEVQNLIRGALKDQALNPQVMVLLSTPTSNVATVGGDVNLAGVRPLDLRGNRLLDAIAAAGGTKFPAYQTDLLLTRKGKTVTMPLQKIVDNPAENIFVQPGDNIYVMYNPPSFTAFGAANKAGRYTFDLPKLYLSDALSEAGGLVDMQADTGGVFLFRSLPRDQAATLFPGAALPADPLVPVIFRVDLSQANGFILAKETEMRNKDLILATNASGTQLLKIFGIVRGVSAPVGDIRGSLRSN